VGIAVFDSLFIYFALPASSARAYAPRPSTT